jgi:hypothetical protein
MTRAKGEKKPKFAGGYIGLPADVGDSVILARKISHQDGKVGTSA